MDEFTNWDIISSLLLAMRWTVLLSLIAFAGGTLITIVLLLLRLTCGKTVNLLVSAHVNLFQGTPLLMQLFLVFFTFPLLGVEVSPWTAAGVCLTLYASAYLIDIWYSAVQSLPKGQWEAAHALNISRAQTIRHIIIPQAALIAVPSVGNYFISLTKDTSLCAVLTVKEVFQIARAQVASNFQPLWMYVEAGIIYLILCTALTFLQSCLEKYLGKHNAVMAALNSSAKKA